MVISASLADSSVQRRPALKEMRAMLVLAWPLILGNLAQMAIHTTDVLILGRFDVDALAAAALGVNLLWVFAILGIGIVTASSPMIAAERGRKANSVRDVRRTVRQAMWLSAFIAVPMLLALWHTDAILGLLGQDVTLAQDAGRFNRIAMWGLLPLLVHIVLRLYVTALERPIWGLIVTIVAVVFNAVLCWALVFGRMGFPALGLDGAAIANAASNGVLCLGIVLVVTLDRRFRRYALFGRFWRSDWPRFWELLRIGFPIGLMLALEVTIFSAAVFLMGLIDQASLAAHAIAIQVAALAFQIPYGIAQAATVRVGLFYGRRDHVGIATAGWMALAIGIAVAAVSSASMAAGADWMIAQFLGDETMRDPLVFRLAVSFLMVAAVFQLVDAIQAIAAGILRGLHDTRWPMVIAGFGYWVVGIGVAIWLGFRSSLAGVGIWMGLAAGLGAVAVLLLGRWMMRDRLGLLPK